MGSAFITMKKELWSLLYKLFINTQTIYLNIVIKTTIYQSSNTVPPFIIYKF